MLRGAVLALVLLAPSASAQLCQDAPQLELDPEGTFEPMRLGDSVEDPFELRVRCPSAPTPSATFTFVVRFYLDNVPEGFEASLANDSLTLEGRDCPTTDWATLSNRLRVERTVAVMAAQHTFSLRAESNCEEHQSLAERRYDVWSDLEGGFVSSPGNVSLRRGQNQDALAAFNLTSTYNTPVVVLTTARHEAGRRLDSVLPPSLVTLAPGWDAQKTVVVTFRTPHQNGGVNFTSTYGITFEVRPAEVLPPEIHDGSNLAVENATVQVVVAGGYVPGPGAVPLLVWAVAVVVALWRRRDT